MMRCFVTGGGGFIGSNLADRLLGDGHEVVAYDNFSTGRRRFVEELERSDGATIVEGDVLDTKLLATALTALGHPVRDLDYILWEIDRKRA